MAATTEEQIERVRDLVASIPLGRVATYGDIASAAGLSSARTVGWIMRTDSADLPWHRVLGASGRPAAHLARRQLAKLELEGVPIRDGRVDLAVARHRF
ncbi:DNA methyltransferase [Rhodococcus hoagii]|uniref:6-O-methylguanine DNA methyltransferase, DNA binding domain protein n=3 Tax=Rhodococcus hoagii TaxID=43767 RepID=E9T3H8_RHOHA|nr:MGMT family protein [Prescottella equi]EGD23402.1 6-O-methylguanine DNA methyltransferase, DNA binding domain protein [Prescottella equi ATCC 33707]MBM4475255.1 DNA methyltransferase [Prescottella equi]MBM4481241.1 DNA methyltransferase [Prescottella equi]MBM4492116.1 DNA methyltransferase [Prescottella equi]MBM4493562.1 DNA methyltransferase [Prescottella equi]